MSFYRALLAAVAAVVLAIPAFADDTTNMMLSSAETQDAQMMGTSMTQDQKINVNKATAKELMKVKGLNAAKARAIVAYRKKNGDFKALQDLNNVKGFKKVNPDKMKEIEDQLTIE